jgi:signal transduction histidine kinase
MGDTVERFLTYARMEKGKLTARLARDDLAAIARDRVKVFLARHPKKSCEIEAPDQVELEIDRVQMELVIDNLLENAAKYAPEGDPYRVVIEDAPAEVVLRVLDGGPGIPKASRKRVFKPFERGDARLSKATEGTGLGLALVRAAAEAHGGTAEIEDGPGGRLVVRLPRAAGREETS